MLRKHFILESVSLVHKKNIKQERKNILQKVYTVSSLQGFFFLLSIIKTEIVFNKGTSFHKEKKA